MKLSGLVSYLAHLETFDPKLVNDALHAHLGPVLHSITTHDLQFYELTDQLINDLNNIQQHVRSFEGTLESVKTALRGLIKETEKEYFINSYQLYDQEMRYDSFEHILRRRFVLNQDIMELLTGRISRYSDWRHPGLIIRPGLEPWTKMLVGLDPLYLLDETYELMHPATEEFSAEYCRRIRKYKVNESRDQEVWLGKLPDGQFSFILAYNFFNFKPVEVIKQYFTELYQKLKSGGIIGFTINDCDRTGGVDLAERSYACYTPKTLLIEIAKSIGYEEAYSLELTPAVTWIELKRPGELTSLRGGQALAKIVVSS